MRLLNTKSGFFEEFLGQNVPPYAILSHTWEDNEVSFKEMGENSHESKKGYSKIQMTCKLASQKGFDYSYVWIDTCCIDKSSSAELTEAINSMFRWYERSEVCFVYLSDLSASSPLDTHLCHCRWFTRGWTLQELIAPKNILFFDQDWNYRSCKDELIFQLAEITGIDFRILQRTQPLSTIAVAQKMSWMAQRTTTRIEDVAYCLLGVFGVHMPMLYGEEDKAFQRLQEEIMKSTCDFSIFAWTMTPDLPNKQGPRARLLSGVLAKSPLDFASCGSALPLPIHARTDFAISNRGIKIHTWTTLQRIPDKGGYRYIFPVCASESGTTYGIRLRKWDIGSFIREDPHALVEIETGFLRTILRTRYLMIGFPGSDNPTGCPMPHSILFSTRPSVFQIHLPPEMAIGSIWPWTRWDDEDQLFFLPKDSRMDWASMKINGSINDRFAVECMFYGLGWAEPGSGLLQCTVMDHKLHQNEVMEINSRLTDFDGDSLWFKESLVHFKIPETTSVVFKFPEVNTNVRISLTARVIEDTAVCQSRFWRVEFTSEVFADHEAIATESVAGFSMDKGVSKSEYLTYPSFAEFLR